MPPDLLDGSLAAALPPLPLTLAAAAIDLRRRIIPDALTLALLVLGLGWAVPREPSAPSLAWCLVQAVGGVVLVRVLRALYGRVRGRTGLGLGDVKFVGAAAWVGLAGLPLLILVAGASALAVLALAALAGRRVDRGLRLPFGPFLALGLHAALLAGHAA